MNLPSIYILNFLIYLAVLFAIYRKNNKLEKELNARYKKIKINYGHFKNFDIKS